MSLKADLLHFVIRIIQTTLFFVPLRLAQKLGAVFGFIAYYFFPQHRKLTLGNLKFCSMNTSIAHRVFVNQGKNLFELFKFYRLNKKNIDKFVKLEGKEFLDKALNYKKGVIVLIAHFGNWELISQTLVLHGYKFNATARKVYINELERLLMKIRESKGANIITRREQGTIKETFNVLDRNELLGMLIDQNTKAARGVYINFFNHRAYTPTALVRIALKTNSTVIPGFIHRQKNDTHILEIMPPVRFSYEGNQEDKIMKNTQILSDIIESQVRKYPDQWVWFHRRWD